jgi:ADP-heptose:LPS heptosyltransferase
MESKVDINMLACDLPDAKRVIVWDRIAPLNAEPAVRMAKQIWPKSQVLVITNKVGDNVFKVQNRCHLYYRKSPISFLDGMCLIYRLKKFRWDVFLLKKHELSSRILFGILLLRPRNIFTYRESSEDIALSKLPIWRFLLKPYRKKFFGLSLLGMLLPLGLFLLQLPLILIKKTSWAEKRNIFYTIKNNVIQGPMGDSPWLFAWLQVVMLQTFLFDNKKNIDKPSRILVIRNDGIGDAINTIPLVRHLRGTYPEARITVLCDSCSFLWENCPYVDEILLYGTNNRLFNRGKKKLNYTFRPFTFLPQLLRRKFDLVIDPVGRTETHILSYLCRGARRIANTYYPYELFGNELSTRHYETQLHETRRVLAMVKPVNQISENECRLEFWFKPEILLKADHVLTANHIDKTDITIGVHPGAMSYLRCWPTERMAVVACKLARKHGMKILFFEPPDNVKATSDFIAKLTDMGAESVIIKEVGLNVLTAIIARCTLFICNDSGPMHLAAATQTPTVAIFGPGEYWRWQPLHPTSRIVRKPIICSPCSQNNCKDPQCILQVDIPDVLSAAESVLAIAQLIT